MIAPDQTVVVAGNGTSLKRIDRGRVLAGDAIVRTNNFYFEDHHWLGPRVDLAYFGGDPRVAPFVFETLFQHGRDYLLGAWTSHNAKVAAAGQARFAARQVPVRYRHPALQAEVERLISKYRRKPMSGTYAAFMAHGYGAQTILLAGMDLYHSQNRYAFATGAHHRALLGRDIDTRGPDQSHHNPDLDLALFDLLASQPDTRVMRCADESPALNNLLPLAPIRPGTPITVLPRSAPPDWVSKAGIYPIVLLRALRRGARIRRQLLKGV